METRTALYIFVYRIFILNNVYGQSPVIYAPSDVHLGVDSLRITCKIQNNPIQITRLQLSKTPKYPYNSTRNSQERKDIVRLDFNPQRIITWQDEDVMNRGTVSGNRISSNGSILRLQIPADAVDCTDEGEYECSFYGPGLVDFMTGENALMISKYVTLRADPSGIRVQATPYSGEISVSNSNLSSASLSCLSQSSGGTTDFVTGTRLILNCTAVVGNPSFPMKWCRKRRHDTNFQDFNYQSINIQRYDTNVATSCLTITTNLLLYDVTSVEDDGTMFLCQVSLDEECGGMTDLETEYSLRVAAGVLSSNTTQYERCVQSLRGPEAIASLRSFQDNETGPVLSIGIVFLVVAVVLVAVAVALFVKTTKLNSAITKNKEKSTYQTLSFDNTQRGDEKIMYETMQDTTSYKNSPSFDAAFSNEEIYAIAQ